MEIKECHKVAAKLLAGEDGDPNLLDVNLGEQLSAINGLCENAGGRIISRQAIAVFIHNWVTQNPSIKPYHHNGYTITISPAYFDNLNLIVKRCYSLNRGGGKKKGGQSENSNNI